MLFIYNPFAGKGAIRANLSEILEEFVHADFEITVHPTRNPDDATFIAKEIGNRFDVLVCCGGDGTLDQVVSGMMQGGFSKPLGYIPAGSTNDFGRSLGIPGNMMDAARMIAQNSVFKCDLGQMNEEYFVYVSAFGAFTEVSYRTNQDVKNVLGHTAYLLEGIRSLPEIKNYHLRYVCEGKEEEGDFIYGMITNSDSIGGFSGITGQDVTLNDGVFEVTLIEDPKTFVEWPGILNALVRNDENRFIHSFKTSKIEFFSDEEIPWTRDGEYGGDHKYVQIANLQEVLQMIVPTGNEEGAAVAESVFS